MLLKKKKKAYYDFFFLQGENINFINESKLNKLVKQIVFVVEHTPSMLKNLGSVKYI